MKTQKHRSLTKIALAVIAIISISFLGKDVAWSQNTEADPPPQSQSTTVVKGDEKPLVILDGEIIDSEILQKIDHAHIESVTILKDESATKIYGKKGKNGVILITMKKPKSGFVDMNKAYILKDGKEITSKEFHRIDHRSVDTIITIVDTLAEAKYGDKAKFGAIIVQSKNEEKLLDNNYLED